MELPGDRIAVKPNFADVPMFKHQDSRSGALFVGRLSPEKGTRVLANASSRHTVTIDVIGTGPDESWMSGVPSLRLLGSQPRSR